MSLSLLMKVLSLFGRNSSNNLEITGNKGIRLDDAVSRCSSSGFWSIITPAILHMLRTCRSVNAALIGYVNLPKQFLGSSSRVWPVTKSKPVIFFDLRFGLFSLGELYKYICNVVRCFSPRLLTNDHKRNRLTISKECLALLNRSPDEFFRRFVTVDGTWITKHQRPINSRNNGVFRPNQWQKKTVFWYTRGKIHLKYLQDGGCSNSTTF